MTIDEKEKHASPLRTVSFGIMCFWGLLVFAGCGEDETNQPVAPQPKPKAVAVANASGPSSQKPASLPRGKTTPKNLIDPQANPEDVFRILPQPDTPFDPNDVFSIVTSDKDSNEASVILPGENVTSDLFRIVKRGERSGSSHQPHPKLKMPRGFVVVNEAGFHEDGLPWRIRSQVDGAMMALVPHGPARLGSNHGLQNAQPEITIESKPFYMDVTEVTVGRYEKFLQAIKKDRRIRVRIQSVEESLPKDVPMTGVPWGDAVSYLKWAGKTLPTEAQWEKAARGEMGFPHPWGHTDAIWFQKRTREQISPVGHYSNDKSPFEIFDLAGNAKEWCADWYRPDAFSAASGKEKALADWKGPNSAEPEFTRVVKGNGPDWNLWHRTGMPMREENPTVGFRGVLTVTNFPLDNTTTQTTPHIR